MDLSDAIVDPDVVSMFPVIVALAPPLNAFSPLLSIRALPAASRIFAVGLIYLKKATVLKMSSWQRVGLA